MKNKSSSKSVYIWLIILSCLAIFLIGAFAVSNILYPKNEFYSNTSINGINVGGLSPKDASNIVQANFINTVKDIDITIKHNEQEWHYTSKDFEVIDNFMPVIENAFNSSTSNNFFERRIILKNLRENNGNIDVSYRKMLGGFDEKINLIENEVNKELKEPEVIFDPNSKDIFTYKEGQSKIVMNKEELLSLIDNAFKSSKKIVVYVPYDELKPTETVENLKQKTSLRSSFSTSIASSTANRKSNVKTALKAFNGQIFKPEQEISFNEITGARTKENGYKPANIILNGIYVEGSGGGVCQASTTLYNALLLANLEIIEVSKHSLPTSYVPLALDAMVSEGVSDLKFKNNTNSNIYIKTWGTDTKVFVEIYGLPFENGEYYKTRSEFVKTIPHSGDRIVPDTNGEYQDKVTFKGEYLRVKYPQEGYEANAYLEHYSKDGTLLESTLIRHEIYLSQEGIIIEGTEDVYPGITLPENTVKFIPPQSKTNISSENVNNKIKGNNNEKYNP